MDYEIRIPHKDPKLFHVNPLKARNLREEPTHYGAKLDWTKAKEAPTGVGVEENKLLSIWQVQQVRYVLQEFPTVLSIGQGCCSCCT